MSEEQKIGLRVIALLCTLLILEHSMRVGRTKIRRRKSTFHKHPGEFFGKLLAAKKRSRQVWHQMESYWRRIFALTFSPRLQLSRVIATVERRAA